MVSQASRHSRSTWLPLGANQPNPRLLLCGQRQPQALVWTREVVKRLKEDHATPQLRAVFTKAPTLPCQWSQGMPQGQVETLNQTGADLETQGGQPRRATTEALVKRVQAASLLLFDQLRIDQFRMGFQHGFAGASAFARARKLLDLVVDRDQRGPVTAEAITEETGHTTDDSGRHLNQAQGALERAWADIGSEQQAKPWREADPHPLAPIRALVGAFTSRGRCGGMLARDEVPQLVQLNRRDVHFAQQVLVDLFSLLRRAAQPLQDSPFGHAQREAQGRQLHFAQQQLEHEDDGLLHRAQIKEDRPAGLRELFTTQFTLKDATPTALGRVGRNRSHIATVHQAIMTTCRVGARLAPVCGCSQGSVLPTVRFHNLSSSKFSYLVKCAHSTSASTLLNTKCPNNLAGETDAPPLFYPNPDPHL